MSHAASLSLRTQFVRLGRVGAVIALLGLSACSSLDAREQRIITGAMIGTAAGAAGTAIMGGCVACGAAVGGVVGAGTGYVVDRFNEGF